MYKISVELSYPDVGMEMGSSPDYWQCDRYEAGGTDATHSTLYRTVV